MPTILVTGANRGLGLEFVRQYALAGWRVLATARDLASAPELQALAAEHTSVVIAALDVTNEIAIKHYQSLGKMSGLMSCLIMQVGWAVEPSSLWTVSIIKPSKRF